MVNAIMKYQALFVFTSRVTMRPDTVAEFNGARSASSACGSVVQRPRVRPVFVIDEGGIISSDVGAHGGGVRRTMMLK